MNSRVGIGKLKAVVLLSEQPYLEANITNPGKYFHALTAKGVLTVAQCTDIRNQKGVTLQVQRFLELLSVNEQGYEVFVRALRDQRVSAHIATHLKKKLDSLRDSVNEGQLPEAEQNILTLLDFVRLTKVSHELARDILTPKKWDLASALGAAKSMGHPVVPAKFMGHPVVPVETAVPQATTPSRGASKMLEVRGYAVETTTPTKEDLLCSECGLILREAVQTSEGFRLCLCCFNAIKGLPDQRSTETGICILAEDGKPLFYPDMAVRREVKRLIVVCRNRKFGCEFQDRLEIYFNGHWENCRYRPMDCPNEAKGCPARIPSLELQQHLAEECQFVDGRQKERDSGIFMTSLGAVPSLPPQTPDQNMQLGGYSYNYGLLPTPPSEGHLPSPAPSPMQPCTITPPGMHRAPSLAGHHSLSQQSGDISPDIGSRPPGIPPRVPQPYHTPPPKRSPPNSLSISQAPPPLPPRPEPFTSTPKKYGQPVPSPLQPHSSSMQPHSSSMPSLLEDRSFQYKSYSESQLMRSQTVPPKHSNPRTRCSPQSVPLGTPSRPRPLGSSGNTQASTQTSWTPTPVRTPGSTPLGFSPSPGVPLADPYLMELEDEEAVWVMSSFHQQGVFFTRPCSMEGIPFTLCLKDKSNLLKYHIKVDSKGRFYINHTYFSSVAKLVEHYRKKPIKTANKTKLTVPLNELVKGHHMPSGAPIPSGYNTTPEGRVPPLSHTPSPQNQNQGVQNNQGIQGQHQNQGIQGQHQNQGIQGQKVDKGIQTEDHNLDGKPTMLLLQSMRDEQFCEIRIMDEIAPRWEQVAIALDVENCTIQTVSRNHAKSALHACMEMLGKWIDSRRHVTWECLIDALCGADFKVLAEKIRKVNK